MGIHWVSAGTPRRPLSLAEDKASKDATVLFVGGVLSMLGHKLVDPYLHSEMERNCGMHWTLSSVLPMPEVNCMLWNNSITTEWLRELICIVT
jgi:hypothetical protein